MIKRSLAIFVSVLFTTFLAAQDKPLFAGMKISKSTKIKKAVYRLDAPADAQAAAIIIQGNNIIIDFKNAELKGSSLAKSPDQFAGTGIIIQNAKSVTIRNLKISGYKVALLAKNIEKLQLENCDFSYNYRPRLNSTAEKEDVSDWMSYHHNEEDEWLRYGAAIYLRNCNNTVIKHCKVTGGQNALMMASCNYAQIFNNDFSFNSGIGIGLYRSSNNRIWNNRLNFNVRGYSHGIYSRGQDSAGILVYEQSNENIFYKNSVTHCGDGFFLWAGQTTMDTGKGGCNDNVIVENDFSYAPTNGIEVTFSRNRIKGNRLFGCDHGIWGGYSYDTRIDDNRFRDNRIAIAIEHGQRISIIRNLFARDKESIRLWARELQPDDWGYAKYRDTRSVGHNIALNSFNQNRTAINVSRTDSLTIWNNSYSDVGDTLKFDQYLTVLDTLGSHLPESSLILPVATGYDPFKGNAQITGRKQIRVTEWGPYDFRSPIIWHRNTKDTTGLMEFDLLGPKGKWIVKNARGVKNISAKQGVFPATITAQRTDSLRTDVLIELEYRGEAATTTFGEPIKANTPHRFYFKKFFQPLDWEVLFFSMDTAFHNPLREPGLFSPLAKMAPVKTDSVKQLDYAWWSGLKVEKDTYKQFITIATAITNVAPGEYELSVTWDDAVRIYLDEQLVLDEWNPSKYTFDQSPNKRVPIKITGRQTLRVEHLELGGFATLNVKFLKK